MWRQLPQWALLVAVVPSHGALYDRAITVFSPEGKLMQVSYAEQAVDRGALAVAITNGEEAIVLCVERPTEHDNTNSSEGWEPSDPADDEGEQNTEEREIEDSGEQEQSDGRRDRSRGQSDGGRITGIVDHANNLDRKLCEIDDGVYFAFAGISADGRALTSKIRLECQSYRYGMGEPPSLEYIARYVGGLQHRFTRTGGARPFGVSCLIAGFDERGTPRIFRSEPSGAFAEWKASAVGRGADKALGRLESLTDLGSLDWRETAEAAVRATLAGGNGLSRTCDVLLLRHRGHHDADRKPETVDPRAARFPDHLESFGGKSSGRGDGESREGGGRDEGEDPLLTGQERGAGVFVSRLVGRMVGGDGAVSWRLPAEEDDKESSSFMTGIRGNE